MRFVILKFMCLTALLASGPLSAERPAITMGNGDQNWIILDGIRREGATLTVPEVVISDSGWLVMHPFKDGKPDGSVYVGATYLPEGKAENVAITIDEEPRAGEIFIVMLHYDVNHNEVFDFIHLEDGNVVDKAVFEGTTMIGHAYQVTD